MALFQTATKAAAKAERNNYLAEIRCGRMTLNASNGMVEPELEKGLLYVHRSKDDMLIHLTWKNRKNGNVLDDLIVFEGDCTVRHIKQLPDHRVFFVRINATKNRKFFWLQHTDKEKDEELLEHLDQALNNTSLAEARVKKALAESGTTAKGPKTGADRTMEQLANLMSGSNAGASSDIINQLMQAGALGGGGVDELLQQISGGAGMSSAAPPAAAAPSAETPVASKKSGEVKRPN